MPSHQLLLYRCNRSLDLLDLCGQHRQDLTRQMRQPQIAFVANYGDQLSDMT
jgi:hypothetical protein